MSIIYDALKKTQQARKGSSNSTANTAPSKFVKATKARIMRLKFKKPLLILGVVSVLMLLLVTAIQYVQLNRARSTPPAPKKVVIDASQYKMKHVLNGVFISENETVAMINKSLFHRGDTIDGMTIASIDTEGVQMKHEDQVVFLNTQS